MVSKHCIVLEKRSYHPNNDVIDAIKLIILNYSNVNIAKIVVNKIERVK